jgi:integrase
MKTTPDPSESDSDWQKTPYANLIRYRPSQSYFARLRVKGKLIRRSLKTTAMTVAKLRLADLEKSERQKVQSASAVLTGKMTFGDALAVYRKRVEANPALKPRTKEYTEFRVKALLKSWPGLEKRDVSQITTTECLDWSATNAGGNSSSSHNHTVSILRHVFQIAMEHGARYDNPALAAKRIKERTQKRIELPESAQFERMVAAIRGGGSGFSQPAGDLVEFLAYGGFRKTEARYVTWADCDFSRGQITVRGHPETGTKNSDIRWVPMNSAMRGLLKRLKAQHPGDTPDTPVMRVFECQKSIDRAAKMLGLRRITHHDLRHLFATRCIESLVDIPTVSRWLGHKDGGALAMKTYGHLSRGHSEAMAQKVKF